MSNPRFPVVYLSIGGVQLFNRDPKHITSFTYEDAMGLEVDAWSATLFDPTFTYLEPLIQAASEDVTLRWGWRGGNLSPLKEAMIMDYTPTFTDGGMEITVQGFTKGFKGAQVEKTRSHPIPRKDWPPLLSYGTRISDIVKMIAVENGWSFDVEETQEVTSSDNKAVVFNSDGSPNVLKLGDGPKRWMQTQMSDLQFIKTKLQPAARSLTGRADYQTYFEALGGGGTVLHFHPTRLGDAPMRVYKFRGRDGEVLKWTPEIKGKLMLHLGAGHLKIKGSDKYTGQEFEVSVTQEGIQSYDVDVVGGRRTKHQVTARRAIQVGAGARTFFQKVDKEDQAGRFINPPVNTREEAEAYAANLWERYFNLIFRAEAEVLGDPRVLAGKPVYFNIFMPGNRPHYSSGKYMLTKGIHTVTGPSYTTTLQCTTNGTRGAQDVSLGTLVSAATGGEELKAFNL